MKNEKQIKFPNQKPGFFIVAAFRPRLTEVTLCGRGMAWHCME